MTLITAMIMENAEEHDTPVIILHFREISITLLQVYPSFDL